MDDVFNNEPVYIISNGIIFDRGTILEVWYRDAEECDVYGLRANKLTCKNLTVLFVISLGEPCPDWDLGI